MEKIGIGIVTCNRPDFFKKCLVSMPREYTIVAVNDGTHAVDERPFAKFKDLTYIKNDTNIGVGKSKNKLFRALLEANCKHIFIVEDDIIIKNPDVFKEYIRARNLTGIQHFNFGYHGPANKRGISGGAPAPRYVVDYGDIKIAINMHSVGAFCYYTDTVLKEAGLIDEVFTNAFEHVDHDYRIAQAGFCTPYWNWPDIANSCDYIAEIQCSEHSSSIRPRDDWQSNIIHGVELFKEKHGFLPAWSAAVPDSTEEQVKQIMKDIYKKYTNRS